MGFTRRRYLLKAAANLTLACLLFAKHGLAKTVDARRLPPQPGDQLAYPSWEYDDRLVRISDVLPGTPPLLVYPRDPQSGVTRERSRLNQILLIRLTSLELAAESMTKELSADGIVAYSGICTHTACGVSEWNSKERKMVCPCHGSEFDPVKIGARVSGPAPRPLPMLPIVAKDGFICVDGPFNSQLGSVV